VFGSLVVVIAHVPGLTRDIDAGAFAILAAAATSTVAAIPLAWWVAQRMVTAQELHWLDRAEQHRGGAGCDGTRADCRCCHHHWRH
jgi:hypothetical protein